MICSASHPLYCTYDPSLYPGVGAVIKHIEVALPTDHRGDANFLHLRDVQWHWPGLYQGRGALRVRASKGWVSCCDGWTTQRDVHLGYWGSGTLRGAQSGKYGKRLESLCESWLHNYHCVLPTLWCSITIGLKRIQYEVSVALRHWCDENMG